MNMTGKMLSGPPIKWLKQYLSFVHKKPSQNQYQNTYEQIRIVARPDFQQKVQKNHLAAGLCPDPLAVIRREGKEEKGKHRVPPLQILQFNPWY